MKKALTVITAVALLASCKSKKDDTRVLSASEQAEFAAFQQWKEAQEKEKAAAETTMPDTKPVADAKPAPAVNASGNTTAPAATPVRKKGWSKAAKGAVIGAGSGAVIGAVVNKRNRAAGAVIGGVIGGAAGYGIGRHQDKKDGRY